MSKLKGRKRGSLLRHVSVTQSGWVASSSFGGLLNHAPSAASFGVSPLAAIKSWVELVDEPSRILNHIKIYKA